MVSWTKSILAVAGCYGLLIMTVQAEERQPIALPLYQMGQDSNAIQVLDQWDGPTGLSKFGPRPIHFNRSPDTTRAPNIGELYYVVD